MYSGNLIIYESSFSNCANSEYGGVLSVNNLSILSVYSSIFENNAAMFGGAIYYSMAYSNVTNSQFLNNLAINGGAILLDTTSQIDYFENVTCNNNYALTSGGCLYVSDGSMLFIYTSDISYNNASYKGSAIYSANFQAIEIYTSTFHDNIANYSTISFIMGPAYVETVTLYDNIAKHSSEGIYALISHVYIFNTVFYNTKLMEVDIHNPNQVEGFLVVGEGSYATIENTTFNFGSGIRGGAISLSRGDVEIHNSSFINCYSYDIGGAIYGYQSSKLFIYDSIFSNNSAANYGNDIYLDSGIGTYIYNTSFNVYPVNPSVYISGGFFQGYNLLFTTTMNQTYQSKRICSLA